MKIAVVIDNLSYGGAQSVCVDYIKILKKLGHKVSVYNLAPSKTEVEGRIPDDITIYRYSLPLNACPSRYYIGIKALKYGKYLFPIIYIYKSFTLFMRKMFCKYRKHQYDVAIAFAGHYNDLSFVAKDFIKSEKKLCWTHGALFQNFMTSDGFLESYLKIKNVIVLNQTAQEEALATNHYLHLNKRLKISLLHNPVDMNGKPVNEGKVKKLRADYGEFVVMPARFSYPHKDQYTVIKAMKLLRDQYHIDKNVVFIGDGEERKKVEKYAREIGMEDQCIFTGSKDDVQNYYSAAHVLVHSSLAFEGFCLTLVEAMYYGIPVVSTDTMVGPAEVLGNNKYGLLCKVGDAEDMAAQLYALYSDKELYDHFVKMGDVRKNDFTSERIGKELADIIKSLK